MATYSALKAKSATLSTTTQDVVTITGSTQNVSVVNRDGTQTLWFAIGPTDTGSISTGGDNVRVVLPNTSVSVHTGGWQQVVVRLLGSSNPYTVQVL